MKNIQNLTIDINKKPFQTITANVGEVASRFIRVTILDNNMPVNLTGVNIYLYAQKADGTKVFNSVKKEDENNGVILAELTSQVLSVEGLAKLTLLLVKDGAKLCSKQFLLNVDSSIVDDKAVESTNEFTALVDALGKVNNIDSRFENVSSQLEHIENGVTYVSPNNFNSLNEAIQYCIENDTLLKCENITLEENTSFRGVHLEVTGTIHLNGYDLELGGKERKTSINGNMTYTPPQYINNIYTKTKKEKVYIRGCFGTELTINYYIGTLYFRLNNEAVSMAYNKFNLKVVDAIDIDDDTINPNGTSVDTSVILWFNENCFNLNRCRYVRIAGSHSQNTNRFYGGCFEGAGGIYVENGGDNIFHDVRNEGDDKLVIHFGKNSRGNKIYCLQRYEITYIDEGYNNMYVTGELYNPRLMSHEKISTRMFKNNQLGNFYNLTLTEKEDALKMTGENVDIYESDFIDINVPFLIHISSILKNGNGLAVHYEVYDENFNVVSNDHMSKHSFMRIMSGTGSAYFLRNSKRTNVYAEANNTIITEGRKNDKLVLYPSFDHISSYSDLCENTPDLQKVKYIRFFITGFTYKSATYGSEFYNIWVSIYDTSANYNVEYYGNATARVK